MGTAGPGEDKTNARWALAIITITYDASQENQLNSAVDQCRPEPWPGVDQVFLTNAVDFIDSLLSENPL